MYNYTNNSGFQQKIREIGISRRIESPFLSDNTIPFGVASTHSGLATDFEFMDGNSNTNKTLSNAGDFLQYEFQEKTLINRLKIEGSNSWTGVIIQASNGFGSDWVELAHLTEEEGNVDIWFNNDST